MVKLPDVDKNRCPSKDAIFGVDHEVKNHAVAAVASCIISKWKLRRISQSPDFSSGSVQSNLDRSEGQKFSENVAVRVQAEG